MSRTADGTELVAVVNPDGSNINSGTGTSSNQIQGNDAAGATDSGNPVKTGGKYNSSAPTYTNGQRGDTQIDAAGNTKTVEQFIPVYEDNTLGKAVVEHRYSYAQQTADTLIKTGAGLVHTVTFSESDAAPTAGTIDIYDNTSAAGTKIFTWTITTTVFNPVSVLLDVSFATGLYIDFTTTADVSVTVSYR